MRGAWVVVAVAAVLCGAAGCGEDQAPPGPSTTLTFTADGDTGAMGRAGDVLRRRLSAAGIAVSGVSADGGTLRLTVPADRAAEARRLAVTGQLRFRPVLRAYPAEEAGFADAPPAQAAALRALDCAAQTAPTETATAPAAAAEIVACDRDGTQKYILAASLFDDDPIAKATAQAPADGQTQWTVRVEMRSAAQAVWTRFTAGANGSQVAITLDDRVLSAPAIQGTITGATQVSGTFTEATAKDLAGLLGTGPLPLVLR
jgi:preprotein translocase subunit SecD